VNAKRAPVASSQPRLPCLEVEVSSAMMGSLSCTQSPTDLHSAMHSLVCRSYDQTNVAMPSYWSQTSQTSSATESCQLPVITSYLPRIHSRPSSNERQDPKQMVTSLWVFASKDTKNCKFREIGILHTPLYGSESVRNRRSVVEFG